MHQIEKLGFLGIARNNFELKGLIGLCTEKFEFLDSVDFGGVVFSVEFVTHHFLSLALPSLRKNLMNSMLVYRKITARVFSQKSCFYSPGLLSTYSS